MQRFHKLAFFNLLFLPIACLFVATTVHSFPQLLLPDDFPVAVAFDRSRLDESFDTSNTSPNSDDLSKTLYSSYIPPDFDDYLESSYSDDSAVPNVATSPEISNTAAIWFEKSDLVNLGTTLASSSLGDGDGRSDVPVQPDPSSTIDASSTDSEASEGNECVLSSAPVKRFYGGDDGGTGSGGAGRPVCVPKVPPQGATDSPTGGPNTSPPKNEPQVPPRGEDDPHEMQGPPDCTRFMGNLRVPFCCPPTSKDKVPGIANNPTRQANCYLFDKTNPDCFDPRNRFCGYCLTGTKVLFDALSPYFQPDDRKNRPVGTPPDAYTLGPPVLEPDPNLSDQTGREIWTGGNIPRGRMCPTEYLVAHGINPNTNRPRRRPPASNRRTKRQPHPEKSRESRTRHMN